MDGGSESIKYRQLTISVHNYASFYTKRVRCDMKSLSFLSWPRFQKNFSWKMLKILELKLSICN